MSTATGPLQLVKDTEPIAGYRLLERVGAGGYGEVWKVAAPGGLDKAIKFVYGRMDDARAERELKALSRVRDVRHPFMISLERIEVVNDQLIIVTELAEQSLKDRFEECVHSDHPGISRNELLGYLRDAADALDYMCTNFSLQHLDIKPENLLLVGGHVKVADFGLVKELQEATASLVSGLTPVYAAPELFDFRATPHSDQYSLAIVYQEMLTGVLPFPGRTPAQLTAQHLHSRPMVGSLPREDRAIITRALSKDPEKRFPDCLALIDKLIDVGKATAVKIAPNDTGPTADPGTTPAVTDNSSPTQSVEKTEVRDSHQSAERRDTISTNTQPIQPAGNPPVATAAPPETDTTSDTPDTDAQIVRLSPLEIGSSEVGLRPTVLIGVGGIGGQTLARLHKRLFARFDQLSTLPIIQMLAFDTDAKALEEIARSDDESSLSLRQTVAIPLRRPQAYRASSPKFLRWLSRRWLYNIPRSLETEGIRPLGRLAFVDHADEVYQRIRDAIAIATCRQSIESSAEATGLDIRNESPRIFVVASISSGTGSGMVLDMGFTVRKALAELELSDEGLCAVLTHATGRNPTASDLATANAYACLSEIYHFDRREECFPGDSACGLPAFGAEKTVFDDVYLLHFGNELTDDEMHSAIDDLADYLYLDVATAAGAFFDTCRDLTRGISSTMASEPQLRTFGLFQMRCDVTRAAHAEENGVCSRVVQKWLGAPAEPEDTEEHENMILADFLTLAEEPKQSGPIDLAELDRIAKTRVKALRLDREALIEQLNAAAEHELGKDLRGLVSDLTTRLAEPQQKKEKKKSRTAAETVSSSDLIQAVNALLGQPSKDNPLRGAGNRTLQTALNRHVKSLSGEHLKSIHGWIMSLVDDPNARLKAALHAGQWFENYFGSLNNDLATLTESIQAQSSSLERGLLSAGTDESDKHGGWFGPRRESDDGEVRLLEYLQSRVREVVALKVGELLETDRCQIASITNALVQIRRTLNQMAEEFDSLQLAEPRNVAPEDKRTAIEDSVFSIRAMLQDALPKITLLVDRKFQVEFLRDHGGLGALADVQSNLANLLPDALRRAAWSEIRRVVMPIDAGKLFLDSHPDDEEAKLKIRTHLKQLSPYLLRCGAATRLLVVLPRGKTAGRMQHLIDDAAAETPTVVSDDDHDLILCQEAEQLSLAQVARKLIEFRPDCADVARRIHTRTDVDWTPIPPGY